MGRGEGEDERGGGWLLSRVCNSKWLDTYKIVSEAICSI